MPGTTANLAIVTGTSTGIGAALARALLAAGWTVAGISRRPAGLREERYRHLAADLGDAAVLDDLIAGHLRPLLAERPWRRVALVNNAAHLGALRAVPDLATADLSTIMAVNVVAPVRLMGFCLAEAPSDAALRVVNVSSGAAHLAIPGLADYCASKAALLAAGRAAAAELAGSERDVRIFSYEPGVVDTPMQAAARAADPARFPSWETFAGFKRDGALHDPAQVVTPIVDFVAGGAGEIFSEARFGVG